MGVQKNSPKTSTMKKPTTTLQHLFDIDSKSSSNGNNNHRSSQDSETEELLSIISYCSFIFTFTDPSESPLQQDLKRLKLLQLLSVVKSSKKPFHDQVLVPLFAMLSANLFRPLPPSSSPSIPNDDDDEPTAASAAAWPHLQVVYDILHKLVLSSDPKLLRNYVNHSFLLNLLDLFQSEDRRERESLKNVYHRIYSKFTFHRSFMRKSMKDVFLHFVFETERHCGIGELLEIWGSIINGFSVPLKEEHKLFLTRVLVPLHKPKVMPVYHRQLSYCVAQFVEKDPIIGGVVVRGILRFWPLTNCQKEVLLLGEMEELVEHTDPEQLQKLALPLCSQIARSLNSWNSQVAERALYLWNNENFVKMASQSMEKVLPSIEGIEKNIKWHWNKSIRQLSSNVKTMLEDMEPELYRRSVKEIENRESKADEEEKRRKEKWERLEMAAAKHEFLQQQCIYVSN